MTTLKGVFTLGMCKLYSSCVWGLLMKHRISYLNWKELGKEDKIEQVLGEIMAEKGEKAYT